VYIIGNRHINEYTPSISLYSHLVVCFNYRESVSFTFCKYVRVKKN